MDELTAGAGSIVIAIAAGWGLLALAMRSPALRWGTTVAMLLAWLAMSLGSFAGAVVHGGRGDAVGVVASVVLGLFFTVLWRALGWPVLVRYWQVRSQYARWWE